MSVYAFPRFGLTDSHSRPNAGVVAFGFRITMLANALEPFSVSSMMVTGE